jgi:hypothetical protein
MEIDIHGFSINLTKKSFKNTNIVLIDGDII